MVKDEKENSLFRKSTLERVSSPEQLNEYIKVTNPNLIIILIGIFAILIAGASPGIGDCGRPPQEATVITVVHIKNTKEIW